MIDYIHQFCREWGDTRYYIDNGKSGPSSIWGRINDGWSIVAADSHRRPDPPEVMLGNALLISIAIKQAIQAKQLTERQFRVLYLHYAERANTKRKIAAAKVSRQRYYDILHRCHRVLRCHLPVDNCQDDNKAETDNEKFDTPTREEKYA